MWKDGSSDWVALKYFIVSKALYGLKSAGASFRSFLAKRFDAMGFVSCIEDPDVCVLILPSLLKTMPFRNFNFNSPGCSCDDQRRWLKKQFLEQDSKLP